MPRIHRHSVREGSRGLRAFLTVYSRDERHTPLEARFEGYVASGARHTGIKLSTDDDTAGVQVFAGVGRLACVWVTVGSPSLAGYVYRRWGKGLPNVDVASLRFHDRAVWWAFWHEKLSWSSKTPRWRKGAFHWWDFLAGKAVFSELEDEPVETVVPMPEGNYKALVTMSTRHWKRPRWPWVKTVHTYNLDVLSRPGPDGPTEGDGSGYIPVPGKGENPWDCGGDGIFSQSGPGRDVETAVSSLVASALRDRRRNGAHLDYAEPIT